MNYGRFNLQNWIESDKFTYPQDDFESPETVSEIKNRLTKFRLRYKTKYNDEYML